MWGTRYLNRGPRWFQINPQNYSGRRLLRWTGLDSITVTNACPQCVTSARGRGTPDPEWLRENLYQLCWHVGDRPADAVLVCGQVAQRAVNAVSVELPSHTRLVYLPHPAARVWSRAADEAVRAELERGGGDVRWEGGRFVPLTGG